MSLPNALAVKLIAAILFVAALGLLVSDRNRWKGVATLRQQQVVAEKAAHSATVANYRAAAEQARRADAANTERVRREQAAINERTADDYEKRLADTRARARELQRQAGSTAAHPGAGRAARLPALPASARGAAEAAGEDRLPDALTATEQAIQLDELVKWVRRQHAVEPNR